MSEQENPFAEEGLLLLSRLSVASALIYCVVVAALIYLPVFQALISPAFAPFLLTAGVGVLFGGLTSAFVLKRIAVAFERTARIEEFLFRQNQAGQAETQSA